MKQFYAKFGPDKKTAVPMSSDGLLATVTWDCIRPEAAGRQQRDFGIDVERCACGGQLKIVAAIEDPVVIARILTHLGLAARAPLRAPAREHSLNHAV